MTGIKPQLHLHQTWGFFPLLLWLVLLRPFADNTLAQLQHCAGQEQMYAVYSPLFLKQEDAYFGSSRGCYIQGRKVFIADFSFPHLHQDSCFKYESWTEMVTLKIFQKVRVYAQTRTHIQFCVSLWEQWPSLCIAPIWSYTLKTPRKVRKIISKSQSLLFRDLLVRQVRHSFINVNLESEHRLLFLLWIQVRKPRSDRAGEQKWCQAHTGVRW